jgi:chromate reductase
MRIVAMSGSLRKASYNRAILFALADVAPSGVAIEIQPIGEIPLFNQDVEAEGIPEPVQRLRDAITAADAVLVATPEYNAGMPGVLKNAIDWVSRPPGRSVLQAKPAAIVGVTPGQLGTARAQGQLRAAFEFCAAPVMPAPQVFVSLARDKFDADGRLTDEKTRAYLKTFMAAFVRWIERNAPAK